MPARRVDRGGADVRVGAVPLDAGEHHLDRAVALVRAHRRERRRLAHDRVARVDAPLGEEPLRAEAADLLVGGEEERERPAAQARVRDAATSAAARKPFVSAAPRPMMRPSRSAPASASAQAGSNGTQSVWPTSARPAARLRPAPADEVALLDAARVGPGLAAGLEAERARLALEEVEHRQVRARGGGVDRDEGSEERDEVHGEAEPRRTCRRRAAFSWRAAQPAPQSRAIAPRKSARMRSAGTRPGAARRRSRRPPARPRRATPRIAVRESANTTVERSASAARARHERGTLRARNRRVVQIDRHEVGRLARRERAAGEAERGHAARRRRAEEPRRERARRIVEHAPLAAHEPELQLERARLAQQVDLGERVRAEREPRAGRHEPVGGDDPIAQVPLGERARAHGRARRADRAHVIVVEVNRVDERRARDGARPPARAAPPG